MDDGLYSVTRHPLAVRRPPPLGSICGTLSHGVWLDSNKNGIWVENMYMAYAYDYVKCMRAGS